MKDSASHPLSISIDREKVQQANKRLYAATAEFYDRIDPRRGGGFDHSWLDNILQNLRAEISSSHPTFLDLGAGTGFLAQRAAKIFPHVIALDLSENMLQQIQSKKIQKIVASCEQTGLADQSVDVVGAFATLHHIYDPVDVFREAYRVLRPDGILFTDHDIEASFVSTFAWPLWIYRKLFGHGDKYQELGNGITDEDYRLTEVHEQTGLNGPRLESALNEIGYRKITLTYHWQGMLCFNLPWKSRYLSPILRIQAYK